MALARCWWWCRDLAGQCSSRRGERGIWANTPTVLRFDYPVPGFAFKGKASVKEEALGASAQAPYLDGACLPVVPDAGDAGTASARVTTTDHQGNVVSFLTVGGTTTQHGGDREHGTCTAGGRGGDHAFLLSGTRAWPDLLLLVWCAVGLVCS